MGHERNGMVSGKPMEEIGSVYQPVRLLVGHHEDPGLSGHCSSCSRTGPIFSCGGDIQEGFRAIQKSSMSMWIETATADIRFVA
jgi:hypothetical protein